MTSLQKEKLEINIIDAFLVENHLPFQAEPEFTKLLDEEEAEQVKEENEDNNLG